MRDKIIFLFLVILTFSIGSVNAQYLADIRFEIDQEGSTEGILRAGQPFRLNVYFQNNSLMTGFYFWPEFVSPDISEIFHLPASEEDIHCNSVSIDPFLNSQWTMGLFIECADWDGILPDRFEYSGITLAGWQPGPEILAFSFNMRINEPGALCVQDGFDYGMYDIWEPLYDFNTPVCWEVVKSDLCGDANNDDDVNILDVLYIVWCLYINNDPSIMCNPEEYDFDDDGSTTILDIVCLIHYLYGGGPAPICSWLEPVGGMTGHSGCLEPNPDKGLYGPDCIAYNYDDSTLILSHLNSQFNCCFDSLTADILFEDNTIIINEYEHPPTGYCDCNCDYNIDYEIGNLLPGTYTLQVHSPYLQEYGGSIEFDLDLVNNPIDTLCVQ